jgi:hypothetical protein
VNGRKRFALLAAAAGLGGCVQHPVGPARTFDAFEAKATTTAEAALSSAESGRLAGKAFVDGKTFGPYAGTVASESEEAAAAVQGTFASIQPPNGEADGLRAALQETLGRTVDDLAALRIALRREDADAVRAALPPVAADADDLRAFVEEHRS